MIEENKEKFKKIISKWLTIISNRDEEAFWFQPSEVDEHYPKYVMKMCMEINDAMPKPMLLRILDADTLASGHVDYHDKFALYCAELSIYDTIKS